MVPVIVADLSLNNLPRFHLAILFRKNKRTFRGGKTRGKNEKNNRSNVRSSPRPPDQKWFVLVPTNYIDKIGRATRKYYW